MYVSSTSEVALNPSVMRALRTSSRDGFLKARRHTPCATAALSVIAASPDLAVAYGTTGTSLSSALSSQRGTLRLAIFALVTAECTLHFLSRSGSASCKHMGISTSDFDNALTSAWAHVSDADTDALFGNSQSGLSLGSYGRLRELSGLTTYRARVRKLTHQALQMAVARSLLVRAIHRIVAVFMTHADDAVRGSNKNGSDALSFALRGAVRVSENEIRRARSILDLMGAKDSWPVIRATFALCHVANQPDFVVDDLSTTFSLSLMSIGRTPKGMAAAIKKAVALAGSARELSVAGGISSDLERQSQVALTGKACTVVKPDSTASEQVPAPKRARAVASDLRGALRAVMLSMRAAGTKLSAPNVLKTLSHNLKPNVQVRAATLTAGIERFQVRLLNAGTSKGAIYDFVVRGNPLSYERGAFNQTIYVLRKAITEEASQPG